MASIALLGASGFTGRLVAAELARRGHDIVGVGRDPDRVRQALSDLDTVGDVRHADVADPAGVGQALANVDVAITTVGPYDLLGRPVLDEAIRHGCHYVDLAGEQPFLRWAYQERDTPARAAGITAVPGAGLEFLVGDLLAQIAAEAVPAPIAVHVTYAVRSRGLIPGSSRGTRRSIAVLLGRPGLALQDGDLVDELLGETRRLAWFPRPLGPSHAAGVPGGEVLTVPRHVPGVRTVRTYVAVPGWQAELLQLTGNATRWAPLRRVATAVLERGSEGPSSDRRRDTRWACVAEVAGSNDEVARAWAYGTDVYRFAAVSAVVVAEAILEGRAATGVAPPALVGVPQDLLDRLAARSDLLWSVARAAPAE